MEVSQHVDVQFRAIKASAISYLNAECIIRGLRLWKKLPGFIVYPFGDAARLRKPLAMIAGDICAETCNGRNQTNSIRRSRIAAIKIVLSEVADQSISAEQESKRLQYGALPSPIGAYQDRLSLTKIYVSGPDASELFNVQRSYPHAPFLTYNQFSGCVVSIGS
jgi:hypothetical protein